MAIIKAKMGQHGKKVKIRNFLVNYMRYRDSNHIIVYEDCNCIKLLLIKSHLKIPIQSL